MTSTSSDPVAAFYESHPYPPPVADQVTPRPGDSTRARFAHHVIWPERPASAVRSVLVAGCGTSQAVRHALAHPQARVVAIDVAAKSVLHTSALAERHGVANLDVRQVAIEEVDRVDERFDLVVCTGVLHHLADPEFGLRRLGDVLAPGGAIKLMVYAPYGRAGVYLMQEYCRRLGVAATPEELGDLVATLREMPVGHPLGRLLRESRDFADDDALADALLNPRDRAYSVPEFFDLVGSAGLRFGRWERQATYLPDCGSFSETPHAERVRQLSAPEQYAALELFRGTIARHTAFLFAADDERSGVVDFEGSDVEEWTPIASPTALAVEERLPAGAAAALLDRASVDTDLVLFVDHPQREIFRRVDGQRTIGQLGDGAHELMVALWKHDLVTFDATSAVRT